MTQKQQQQQQQKQQQQQQQKNKNEYLHIECRDIEIENVIWEKKNVWTKGIWPNFTSNVKQISANDWFSIHP